MRTLTVNATVRGITWDSDIGVESVKFSKRFQKIKAQGLMEFAKEVRRRARIRLAVNRSPYPSGSDRRYGKRLADAIDFVVDDQIGTVTFDVGAGLPYARIEDQSKDVEFTQIQGNPTMKFFWYRMGKPFGFSRPGYVIRRGKGFFTGALESALEDIDKIFGRAFDKGMSG